MSNFTNSVWYLVEVQLRPTVNLRQIYKAYFAVLRLNFRAKVTLVSVELTKCVISKDFYRFSTAATEMLPRMTDMNDQYEVCLKSAVE